MRKTGLITLLMLLVLASVGPTTDGHQEATAQNKDRILFDSDRSGAREIYMMDSDGSNVARLTHTPGEQKFSAHPAWSPGGTRIVFFSDRDRTPVKAPHVLEIYLMAADGSNVQRLTHTPGEEKSSWRPAWSPDSERIAFVSNRDELPEVYVMRADGSNLRRLTFTPRHGPESGSWNPAWSPDGTRIAFDSSREGPGEIYAMASDGTDVRRLTHTPAPGRDCGTPAWSPDGKKIAFVSNRDAKSTQGVQHAYDIYVMDADGSGLQRLTHDEKGSYRPAWSSDGRRIVFQSAREGSPENLADYEIYIMEADGSQARRLTTNRVFDGHPAWSPRR